MSYSVGDKFVLEIKEIDNLDNHMVLDNTVVGIKVLDKLERLDSDYVNEHFGELQDEAYKAGEKAGFKTALNNIQVQQKDIKFIAAHYGYESQSRQLIEEMAELTVAINKYHRAYKKRVSERASLNLEHKLQNIAEEIADVEIMLAQVKLLLGCSKEVEQIKATKVTRQIKRIEGE